MPLFKRPMIWAIWVLVGTLLAVARILPQLTAPSQPQGNQVAAVQAPAPTPAQKPGSGPKETEIVPDSRGHHRTFATVAGRNFQVLVDTGASLVVLTEMDASNMGFRPRPHEFTVPLATANGSIRGARYRIDSLKVGAITLHNVDAVVLPRGALQISLLGQSFLRRLASYEVKAGRLILRG
jgi:aspartyl protease family protein